MLSASSPGRFPNSSTTQVNNYEPPSKNLIRTKVLMLGNRRVGKTSIYEHLFNELPAKQTFYLEMTTRVTKHPYDTVIPLEIHDYPGIAGLADLDAPLKEYASLVFVIDIQDRYILPVQRLVELVIAAYQENPEMSLEVFVHKADALSEEYKIETFRQIQQHVSEELLDVSEEYEQIPINFHLTSIYDHSTHEAFSKVLHRMIGSLPFLEDMLNVFCSNSQSSKAFLFDTRSRLYVATDASPVDPLVHSLCTNYLQMLNSFGSLYRSVTGSPLRQQTITPSTKPTSTSPSIASPQSPRSPTSSASQTPRVPFSSLQHQTRSIGSNSSGPASPSISHPNPNLPPLDPSHPSPDSLPETPTSSNLPTSDPPTKPKFLFYPCASTSLSPSSSGAANTLTYHLITPRLALLTLLPTHTYETKRGLVEYNVVFFREGIQEICDVEEEMRKVVA